MKKKTLQQRAGVWVSKVGYDGTRFDFERQSEAYKAGWRAHQRYCISNMNDETRRLKPVTRIFTKKALKAVFD